MKISLSHQRALGGDSTSTLSASPLPVSSMQYLGWPLRRGVVLAAHDGTAGVAERVQVVGVAVASVAAVGVLSAGFSLIS